MNGKLDSLAFPLVVLVHFTLLCQADADPAGFGLRESQTYGGGPGGSESVWPFQCPNRLKG